MYFCMAVHELLTSLKSELAIGYLDDFSLGDEADVVAADFREFETRALELGHTINR